MELEPGYKLSEAGPIPEDWETVTIGTRAAVQRGASPRPIDSPAWFDNKSEIGWVRIADVSAEKGAMLRKTEQYVSPAGRARSRYIEPGTLIMSICATIGLPKTTAFPCCIHDGFVAFSELRELDQSYFQYVLGQIAPYLAASGQTGSQANLNTDMVKAAIIVAPPIEEQRAVAAALADIDDWIADAELEAEKLAGVKAAAMDALLTPITRLSGFSGEWCPVRLGDLYDPLSTVAVARAAYVDGDGVACIHYGDIHVRYDGFVRIGHDDVAAVPAGLVRSAARLLSGDVLIADAAEDLEGVGKAVELIAPANFQVVGGLHVQALRPKAGKLALGFAGYLFRQRAYREAVERAASGLKVYGISKSQLSALEVVLPPTLDEQQAIAAVLSDIDAALSASRAVVGKARSVKAAAMGALLSGRVRLPGFGQAVRRASADALEAA